MTISKSTRAQIESVAENTLSTFEKVSEIAKARLSEQPASAEESLAAVNTLTSGNAIGTLGRIIDENRATFRHLMNEPAISRVVAVDEDGTRATYFICRTSPVQLPPGAASHSEMLFCKISSVFSGYNE